VVNTYTYDPFGSTFATETIEGIENNHRFAGYTWDDTIKQYYCQARWYDPILFRFTSRDPVTGNYQEPMTLHAYLYCLNNPVNRTDPQGRFSFSIGGFLSAVSIGLFYTSYANAPGQDDYIYTNDAGGEMVTGLAGSIILCGTGHAANQIFGPWIRRHLTINKLLGRQGSKAIAPNSTRGWKVGDPINNLTSRGKTPKWDTVRNRYWKNRAHNAKQGQFSEANLSRMKKGLAPQKYNRNTGKFESVELHHIVPQSEGGLFYFIEMTPEQHAATDTFRYLREDF